MNCRSNERVPGALFVFGITVLALVLRFAIAKQGGFWRDEAQFLFVARLPSWTAMLEFLRIHESHPPLFYVVMRGWILVFGDTDAGSIILPVAIGVALIPALYLIGKALFSEQTGLAAAALATFSPALVEYSAESRPYSLMPFLTLLSTYTLIRCLERGEWRAWSWYCLFTLALVYTHNWGWLVFCGHWAAVLVVIASVGGRVRAQVAKEWLLVQLAIAGCFLPWLATLFYQARHAGHPPSPLDFSSDFLPLFGLSARELMRATILGYASDGGFLRLRMKQWLFVVPVMILVVDQYLRARGAAASSTFNLDRTQHGGRRDKTALRLACLLAVSGTAWIVALLLSRDSNLMLRRCLVALAPLVLLALAHWLARPRRGAMLVLGRAAMTAFILTYALSVYDLAGTTRSNARGLAAVVAEQTRPSDLLVVSPEWLASSFNRYYSPAIEQINFPYLGREGAVSFSRPLDRFRDEAAAKRVRERIKEARNERRRVWLIVERDKSFTASPATIDSLLKSPNYQVVANARTNQLLSVIDSLYGQPDTSVVALDRRPRYENLRAFLFSPSEAASNSQSLVQTHLIRPVPNAAF